MKKRDVWIPGEWTYESLPPYEVGHVLYGAVFSDITTLEHAVRTYWMNFVPLIGERSQAWISDGDEAVVLGCWNKPGGEQFWTGVAEAFRPLSRLHNPLEVACWELVASGTVAAIESEFE